MSRLAVLPWATLILLGATVPLHAQNRNSPVGLTVCNKGTIAVEVVAAEKNEPFMGVTKLYYNIRGKSVTPGKCAQVHFSTIGQPAYIGFGFYDALGRWGSGRISHVPDFGTFARWFHDDKVMAGADKAMCTRKNEYRYSADGDLPSDCPGMTAANAPDAAHGPFVPVTAALYFETDNQTCVDGGVLTSCAYYLNIPPSPSDWELHATRGTSSGQDVADDGNDSAGIHFLRALAKAVADYRQREARDGGRLGAGSGRHGRSRAAALGRPGGGQRTATEADPRRGRGRRPEREGRGADDQAGRSGRPPAMGRDAPNPPAAYDPQWMGQNMVLVGTVSRVEVDPNGSPQWVSIYFKESPDATVVVCSPYPDMFQERVGQDLSALVGKTLEAAGQVESPYCGKNKVSKASIGVVESKQWQVH